MEEGGSFLHATTVAKDFFFLFLTISLIIFEVNILKLPFFSKRKKYPQNVSKLLLHLLQKIFLKQQLSGKIKKK